MILPDTIDDDLLDILGQPNFTCGSIAQAMRLDGAPIPRKAEAEQAHVLFKLLGFYAAHGAAWRESASAWISDLRDRAKAAVPA